MQNTKKLLRFYLYFHSRIYLGILRKPVQSQNIVQRHTVKLIGDSPQRITFLDRISDVAPGISRDGL